MPRLSASTSKKKGTRGPTRLKKLMNRKPGEKIDLLINDLGQYYTQEATTFANYLGTIARDGHKMPIDVKDWRQMPSDKKEAVWEVAQVIYDLQPNDKKKVMESLAKKWREWKSYLKTNFFDRYDNDDDRIDLRDRRALYAQFVNAIDFWKSDEGQKRSRIGKINRGKQNMPHTTGSKSFARVRHGEEMKLGRKPSRMELFIKTHTNKDGTPSDGHVREKIVEMQELASQVPEESLDPMERDDIFSQVMGPERRGHIRGLGAGVSYSCIWSTSSTQVGASNTVEVERLQEHVATLQKQLQASNDQQSVLQRRLQASDDRQSALEARLDALAAMLANQNMRPGPKQ